MKKYYQFGINKKSGYSIGFSFECDDEDDFLDDDDVIELAIEKKIFKDGEEENITYVEELKKAEYKDLYE